MTTAPDLTVRSGQSDGEEAHEHSSPETAELDAANRHAWAVKVEAQKLRVRTDAARIVAREKVAVLGRPVAIGLADFLAVTDPVVTYRVGDLWPVGGRVVLAAPNKAGKSTLIGNVLRSLADGDPLLGQFPTEPARVVLIDNELDFRTLRLWLRAQGIVNEAAVRVISLRGRVSTFSILDAEGRAEWAKELTGADVVILDCLRPVLDALGLSEDKDAGKFLVAFDELLARAGASEAVVVVHMGHSGERSRGDSRILDWPDATWKLVREVPDDPASTRYLSAYGRDVDLPEGRLDYDRVSRRLTWGGGSRKDTAADTVMASLLVLLADEPLPLSGRAIERALMPGGHTQAAVRSAVKQAARQGLTTQVAGPKGSILNKLASVR